MKDTDTEPGSTGAGTPDKTLIAADRLNENFRVMNSSRPWAQAAAIDRELRFGNGFSTAEHPDILRVLSTLDIPLAHYTAAGTELELSVQNRDRPGQLTTLECWIVGSSHLVATSTKKDLTGALTEVRDDLHRQLDAKTAADRESRARASAHLTAPVHQPSYAGAGTNTPPVLITDTTAGNDRHPPHNMAGSRSRETQLAAERVAHRGRLRSALVGFVEPYEKWRDWKNARKQPCPTACAG